MDLTDSLKIAAAGMRVQSDRLRVISQNVANANSTSDVSGGDPYRRKTISFKNTLDRELGVETVKVSRLGNDPSDFRKKFDPGHPASDNEGYVKLPNVETMVEMVDMREAQRSYEANLNVITTSKEMINGTLELLR